MTKLFFRNIRSGKRRDAIADLESITRMEMEKVFDVKIRKMILEPHKKVVSSWDTKISFSTRKDFKKKRLSMFVHPVRQNKEIWIFVDQGTKPHTIENVVPKSAKSLKFQLGGTYNPKTLAKPARTVPSGGTTTGGVTVYAKRVTRIEHPGSEGRFFSKQIGDDILPNFRREIENAFRRTARQVEE